MPARRKIVVPALVVLASIGLIGSASSPKADAAEQVSNALLRGDIVALNVKGLGENSESLPGHFVFRGMELVSLANGETVGTAEQDVTCVVPTCSLVDVVATFHLPEGNIVNKARHTVLFDPQHPGWIMANTRPGEDSIVSTTGIYSGRHGVGRMSGTNDVRALPASAVFDEYFVISLR